MPHDNISGLTSESDEVSSLSEEKDKSYSNLGSLIESRLKESEQARLYDEKRWLRSYRNYRGIYSSDMAFRDSEKSKVFVKITKTKVLAAYGQLIEVLFSQGKFPIGIFPTTDPTGAEKYAHIKPENMQNSPRWKSKQQLWLKQLQPKQRLLFCISASPINLYLLSQLSMKPNLKSAHLVP